MGWVLIVYLGYSTGGFSAEFSTREKCEAAGAVIVAQASATTSRFFKCFEK
jgi:hypothetical protein